MNRTVPLSRDRYPHFHTIDTRWMDNDVYGHVNNVVYYSFFDTAVNAYMLNEGVLDYVAGPTVSLVVDTACAYFSPLRFPDVVHCGLRVEELGTSSVRYGIGIFRNDDPQPCAQGRFVHVCCDRVTRRPVPMPAALRAALSRLQSPA